MAEAALTQLQAQIEAIRHEAFAEGYAAAMEAALPGSTASGRPDPTPDEAMATWPLITERELSFLSGETARPPSDSVPLDWGEGSVFARPDAPRPSLASR